MSPYCFACEKFYRLDRPGDVISHAHAEPMPLCWEHVRYEDAPVHPSDRACTDTCPVGAVLGPPLPYESHVPKLVSVITPTWGRHALLVEAIENVRAQTYPNIEHVIVSDGVDDALMVALSDGGSRDGAVPIRFVQLGRRWTLELADSYAAAPMMVAQLIARGDYQMWFADDERMEPWHVDLMVKAVETTGADFAYPRVAYYRWDAPEQAVAIGCSPPVCGSITTMLYRTSVFDKARGLYRTHAGRASDWEFIERMMAGGASHVFVDRVTFSHRDDFDCPPEMYAAPIPEYANA